MARTETKKLETSRKARTKDKSPKYSQLGKAILEALNDIKNGNLSVVRKEDLKRGLRKFFE